MSIVFETLVAHLPSKRKQTPSGWLSFNAPCCIHNGDTADKRQRGGLINNEQDGVSYHCFNCGYKASWKPGRKISYKLKKLMEWLNVPDATITKVSLAVLETENIELQQTLELPKFDSVELPEGAKPLTSFTGDIPDNLVPILDYLHARQLYLEDYNFYWTDKLGYRDRLIVPFYYHDEIVGYTARSYRDNASPKYLSNQQPGYVFNLDTQSNSRVYTVVVEGPFDAIAVEGVALLGSEVKDQQAMLINSINTKVIVVPDRDDAGHKLVEQAIELGWGVAMPDWEGVNDVNEAVQKYGKIYTLHTIVGSAEFNKLKIQLRSKKWFG